MSIIQGTSKAAGGDHTIDQSARFNDGDSPELSRTYTLSAPWTFSAWVKRCELGAANILLGTSGSSPEVQFNSGDTITAEGLTTTAVFRDPAAWYHVHVSDNGLYINGVSYGSVTTTSLTNAKLFDDFDGYAAEVHLQSGTSAYTNFGVTNAGTGEWVPKAATAGDTYLKFANSSDFGENSGTGGAWTASGLTSADQMLDTPTLNAATLNPLWAGAGLSDGNLVATATGNSYQRAISTFAIDDGGKYACEFQKSSGTFGYVGLYQLGNHTATTGNNYGYFYNLGTGEIIKNSSVVTDLGTGAANSLMRLEYDSATDTLEFFDDGVSIYSATTGLTGQNSLHFGCAPFGSGTKITATFQGLSGTPTADFLELTSANLDDPTIADPSAHMQTTLYTGTGSSLAVTQSGNSTFQPDWVWIKGRSGATEHVLTDAVRGVTKELSSNDTGVEETVAQGLTTFGSAGFTVGTDGSYNTSSATYVGWQWKANGAGSSNTDGSITSTVSNNSTAGFSIGTYTGIGTGPGDAPGTVGHGLGISPGMIIIKDLTAATEWYVWHQGMSNPAQSFIYLNTTGAAQTSTATWNNTAPTSSVFSIGWDTNVNTSGNSYVFYAFAEIPGYSSIGSYTGNSSATDGPFVYTGFKPAFVMLKRTNSSGAWTIFDNQREGYNVDNDELVANTSAAETTTDYTDILSNGFKLRSADTDVNASGGTYIYMAFAETPFKTATAR